ncbi:MAG TPA: glycosyltransferase family 39 protein [bacterium]|jgi:4-amino-4-deoxy-L-arabinose transferase-like glycosyltransferase
MDDQLAVADDFRTGWIRRLAPFLKISAACGAAGYILMFIVLALRRMAYPFELEWMEGLSVDHVQRVLDGLPLYVPPSVDFVPSIYTPLYYYVAAIPAAVLGNGFVPVRLISFLASLGSMALLFVYVRKEAKDNFAGLIAAGLYASTYYLTGAWLDIARVDALFVFFLLLAVGALRFHPTRTGWILAALLTTLAFLTKQTGLLAALFFMIYAVTAHRKHGLYYIAAFVLFTGTAVLGMDWLHHGWFNFYVFEVPAGHPIETLQFLKFFAQDTLRPMPLASLFILTYLLIRWLKGERQDIAFYVLVGMGFLAAAGAPRVKAGNYVNDLIPAYAFLAMVFGISIPALRNWYGNLFAALPASFPDRARIGHGLSGLFYALIAVQLIIMVYGPTNQIPTPADRATGTELIHTFAAFKGDVWVVHHGYMSVQSGKRSHSMSQPFNDVLCAGNPQANKLLLDDLNRALQNHRFAAIVTDTDEDSVAAYCQRAGYICEPISYADEQDGWPISGYPTRPSKIYLPQEPSLADRTAP